ncbi:MAG: YfbK domain-containing protein [Pseudomonadota bacterium]
MTDPDLTKLSSLDIPTPRAQARDQAVLRGVYAYTTAQHFRSQRSEPALVARLWKQLSAGLRAVMAAIVRPHPVLASLLVVAVALPVAFSLINESSEPTPELVTPAATPEPSLAEAAIETVNEADSRVPSKQSKSAFAAPSHADASDELRTRREIRPRASERIRQRQTAAVRGGSARQPKTGTMRRPSPSRPMPFIDIARQSTTEFALDGGADVTAYLAMRAAVQSGKMPSPDIGDANAFLAFIARDETRLSTEQRQSAAHVTTTATPWNPATRLVHVRIARRNPADGRSARLFFNPAAVSSWRRLAQTGVGRQQTRYLAVFEVTPARRWIGSLETNPISNVTLTSAANSQNERRIVVTQKSMASLEQAAQDVRFAIAAIAYARKLGGMPDMAALSYAAIADLAFDARGDDADGRRGEFIGLVRLAGAAARQARTRKPSTARIPSAREAPASRPTAQ